jgi:hypothetical protein
VSVRVQTNVSVRVQSYLCTVAMWRLPSGLAVVLCACTLGLIGTQSVEAAQIYTYDALASIGSRASAGSPRTEQVSAPRRPARGESAVADRPRMSPVRAASGPPLVQAGSGGTVGEEVAGTDASSSASTSGGDPLVENGLGSPLCGAQAGELSASSQRNCETSGFEAAGAPTGDYALDVHIDTGALGFTMSTIEQDYVIGLVWMGLVWIVHTLIVALEWCFTLDLLNGSAMGGLERTLRDMQAAFTRPWLVLALALASIAAAYNGLIRRRVAETVGQAGLMLAMMACGLWVIFDPTGTIGALGRWIDEASVGTLGVVVEGTPARATRTLADSMGGLFAGVVGAPWCYLEFGDERWCVEPALLDKRLEAAALAIAAGAQSAGGCTEGTSSAAVCQALRGEQPRALAQSARLLRAARTNGELFLALPANAAARNSINDEASLLRALCGSNNATGCRGPTAPEAEFRTQGGTLARLGGLLLIALGALGMLLLLGFIALHLLGSELVGLLYLLLAPAAVITPALGDGGRAAFRSWAVRLLGAVTSKLVFSFLLGVVLLLTRTLLELYGLGWWTRWLLVSAMWWGSYLQRRRVLGFLHGERAQIARHDPIARRVQRQLESPLVALTATRWVRHRLATTPPNVERRRTRARVDHARVRSAPDVQATRLLTLEHAQAVADVGDAPRMEAELGEKGAQLQRVRVARERAAAAGDGRRVALLAVRARRIEGEARAVQDRLSTARETVADGRRVRRASGRRYTRAEVEERGRFLDAQAQLAPSARSRTLPGNGSQAVAPRRDYTALAGLVGYESRQYERLDARLQRDARLKIDRELALRREEARANAGGPQVPDDARAPVHPPTVDPRQGPRTVPSRQALGTGSSRQGPRTGPSWQGLGMGPHAPRPAPRSGVGRRVELESPVMRDAREVAQRRKRHLGV